MRGKVGKCSKKDTCDKPAHLSYVLPASCQMHIKLRASRVPDMDDTMVIANN